MAHYATHFSINRLQMEAHLGVTAAERKKPQPVAVSLRLYFPSMPACTIDDDGVFIDYHALSDMISHAITGSEYKLIEFMAKALFDLARNYLNAHNAQEVALWLKLTKLTPAVAHLQEGAAFVLCDLPTDATTSPVE